MPICPIFKFVVTVRIRTLVAAAVALLAIVSLTVMGGRTASASPLPKSWKLVFDPNFPKTSVKGKVNPKTWATCCFWASNAGCTNASSANAEKEWYLPSQVSVAGGVLRLTAARATTKGTTSAGKPPTYGCRSGLSWYYDGRSVYTTVTGVPHQAMYFIANLADTNAAAANTNIKGGACNGTLLVQSVEVWQP